MLTVAQFSALVSPEDGDEVYLEVDATNGVMWHLRYVAAETTYKWRKIGGPPLLSEVLTAEATSSTTYVALTTAGPSIALPRAGDYDVPGGVLTTTLGIMSYDIGATAAVDADAVGEPSSGAGTQGHGHSYRKRRKAGLTSATLTAKYKTPTGASVTFEHRSLQADAVRVRHDA